jgi:hypothetical protein
MQKRKTAMGETFSCCRGPALDRTHAEQGAQPFLNIREVRKRLRK